MMVLLPLALAFLGGLCAGYNMAAGALAPPPWLLLAGLAALLGGGWVAGYPRTAVAACLVALLGLAHGAAAVPAAAPGDLAYYTGRAVLLTGTVAAEPDIRDHATFLFVAADQVDTGNGVARPVTGLLAVRYGGRPAVEYGDLLRLRGRLRGLASLDAPGYRAYLRAKGVGALIEYPGVLRQAHGAGNPLAAAVLGLRAALERTIAHMVPQPEASLLAALLLGGRGAALGNVSGDFVAAGMIHVVATSGLKVALVVGLVYRLALLAWGLRWAFLPTLLAAAGYVALTGGTPAGLRAGLMWTLALLAGRLGRRSHALTSLALTAAVMAALQPSLVGDIGFQLSVVGTAGVIVLTDPLHRRLHRLPPLLGEGLAVTIAAQVVTAPLVAGGFGQLSLVGPLANAVCLPLMALAMAVGGVGAAVGLVVPGLARLLGAVVYPLLWAMVGLVRLLAALPAAFFVVPAFGAGLTALYYALLVVVVWRLFPEIPRPAIVGRLLPGAPAAGPTGQRSGQPGWPLAGGATAIAALIAVGWQVPSSRLYRVTFLNTCCNQVVLVQTPRRQIVLIDGGDGAGGLRLGLGALLPFWQHDLTLVLLSATDRAHSAGLLGLAGPYRVRAAADTGSFYPGADYALWRADLRNAGVPHTRLRAGTRLLLDEQTAIDVLAPGQPNALAAESPTAYRLWLGGVSVLLLNRQALRGDLSALRADRSPLGAGATRDTVVVVPLLPQAGDPTWRLLAAQRPAVAVLPSLGDATAAGARTAPLAVPGAVARFWQGEPGSHLDLWTDGHGYRVDVTP